MDKTDLKFGGWSGLAFALGLGASILVAGFLPPPSPALSAEAIAAFYQENSLRVIVGMLCGLLGAFGYLPLTAAISMKLRAMQGVTRMPAYLQLASGAAGTLMFVIPFMFFAITAFRPDRDPQLTMLLNDISWLLLLTPFSTFVAQNGAIAYAIFHDQSAQPVYPRWVAYFNLWVAVLFIPAGMAYLFKTGPFAWDGIFPFWIPAGVFFLWLAIMSILLLRSSGER